ncbi:hypothetical protein [Streptosporangium sp. NPDC006930]|uniref:hypothetical protein n=1 Tax=Streptosporangium sp. NPDC006930 TaxID=3154783 RepID=UPI003441B462
MMKNSLTVMAALAFVLTMSTACQGKEAEVNRNPLPTEAAPPYICDHIPLKAVELMTGVRNPQARGSFDLTAAGGLGIGSCVISQREGEKLNVLLVDLTPGGHPGPVEEQIEGGATPLPEILPGVTGYYFKRASGEDNAAFSTLVRSKAEINIQLEIGAEGRDNAADVLALMKLIAPKLLTDASAPSPTPKSPTPKKD